MFQGQARGNFPVKMCFSVTIVLVWCTGIRGLQRRSNTIVLVAEIRQKLQTMQKQNLMFIYDI
jgi:hypothetical protein